MNNLHLDLPLSQAAFKDDLTTAKNSLESCWQRLGICAYLVLLDPLACRIATWQKMEQWNDGIQGVADEAALAFHLCVCARLFEFL